MRIDQGTCHIKEINVPMDLPRCCPKCGEDLDSIDLTELNSENYWDAELVCPECGKIINLSDEYNIEILEYDWDEE